MSNDILQRIKNANGNRQPEPLQLKYAAMAENPFRFFRGSCGLFYEELANEYPFPPSPAVWACGDLHIENFGSYKGRSRLVYFDMNDFDEALMAPALWELCRLTASVQVAADEIKFSKKEKAQLVETLLYYYTQTLKLGKPLIIERETAKGLIKNLVTKVEERKASELIKKRTSDKNPDKLQLNDRLFALPKPEKKALVNAFDKWLQEKSYQGYSVTDAGFRIAGTGSIGVKRYLLLLKHNSSDKRKWLVDVKQSLPSAVSVYINAQQPAWPNEAMRIIGVQEMMQHVSPAFLSSFQYDDKWFVVKELQPTADKISLAQAMKQPTQLQDYVASLGTIAASGQLRSSGRKGAATADELNAFASGNNWENIVRDWSASYAVKVKQEYMIYKEAWSDGFFAH